MAAKKTQELTFAEIVMGAEADVIKQAYEARLKIDEHLAAREEAYRQIAELEQQVEETIATPGEFVYPAPPFPVAGINKPSEASRTFDKPTKSASSKSSSSSSSSSRGQADNSTSGRSLQTQQAESETIGEQNANNASGTDDQNAGAGTGQYPENDEQNDAPTAQS